MPKQIVNLTGTTELEAINAMLLAIGEDKYASLVEVANSPSPDVARAVDTLRNVTRDVQAMGWKFNKEFGYEIEPADQYDWIDTDGVTTPLNIFTPPSNLVSFTPTPIIEQLGSNLVDSVIRPSVKYLVPTPVLDENDEPVLDDNDEQTYEDLPTMVFYDRMRARDGFPVAQHAYLYIDPVWLFNFEQMPEVARAYVAMKAARKFTAGVVGSQTLVQFSEKDEQIALRNLKVEQGLDDDFNMLRNNDMMRVRGGRPGGPSGRIDSRLNRGHV